MVSPADSLLAQVWAQVVTALDRAAEAAHHLNRTFGDFREVVDDLHATVQGSERYAKEALQNVLGTVAGAAKSLWTLQLTYLDAEQLIYGYTKRLDGTPPPRTREFPGHVEPDAYFGPNPDRHYPALVKVPLVRATHLGHRTVNWATRVRRGLPEWGTGKTDGALYVDSDHSWRLLSGIDHGGGLTRGAEKYIGQAIDNGFFDGKPTRLAAGHARMLRRAATHVETKAAVWARQNSQSVIDVVTNRDYVCGENYNPAAFAEFPGCFQAVELILRRGQTMRVWVVGAPRPVVIEGKAER